MKQLAILVLSSLVVLFVVACGGDTAEPTSPPAEAATAVPPTQAPPAPTNTPVPEPTATPTTMPEPTATPEPAPTATSAPDPTATPEPAPTSTPAPEPTATPVPAPTATPEPDPTATPEPAPTATPEPEPTATPEPTTTPTPEPTAVPVLPIAADLAPLGDSLLWVAHIDAATQKMYAYDPSGTFTPDQATPPSAPVPDPSEVLPLTELEINKIYTIRTSEEVTAELNGRSEGFPSGIRFLFWR